MKSRLTAALIASFLAWSSAGADVEQGRAKSLACQACHGANGQGTAPDIPNLAGQKAGYLQSQLAAFRSGDRRHELMNAIAAQLSDTDIANLAAFWNSLPADAATHGGADPAAEFRRSRLEFPAEFPAGFVVYFESRGKDGKVASKSYVTRAAVAAARAGKPLPDGTAIVVEDYANGVVASYAAMATHTGWGEGVPELLENGDWSYALFDAAKQRREFNHARCLACHKPQEKTSYVFGYAEIAKAK